LCEATVLSGQITGNTVPIESRGYTRPGDVKMYISDATLVSRECHWKPTRSAQQVCEDIFNWLRANETKIDW
jgi:UDP-glucose 4-epimerase